MIKKKNNVSKPFFLSVLVLILCSGAIYNSEFIQKAFIYKLLYEKEIKNYASQNNIEPCLVASIIKNESNFRADAFSAEGAVGIMQIMPSTGQWIADKLHINKFNVNMLKDPETNIKFGCWYIKELQYEFNDEIIAIAAYNAGRGNVRQWLEKGIWDGNDIEQIPFIETKLYVKKVINSKIKYKSLYSNL